MDCARARSLLHPWLDGELDREEHRAVVEHLGICEGCDARFKDEQRLLARVKTGLAATCPRELRAAIALRLAAASPSGRGWIISFKRAAAAAAVLVGTFMWTDPLCLRGCPTVRALSVLAHASPAHVSTSTAAIEKEVVKLLDCPLDDLPCNVCCELMPVGWDRIECCAKGCMIRFRDARGRPICFIKMRDRRVHPWLQLRAGSSGLIVAAQDGCRFAGWKDAEGGMCGFVCDDSVAEADLVAMSERVRHH